MTETLFPFIDCIESLSKSPLLRDGDVFPFVREVLRQTSETLQCERVNVWMLEENDETLANLLSYNRILDEYELQSSLDRKKFPNYFNNLLVNEIIVANDAANEKKNRELVLPYILPNGIKSMIDVPLRDDGQMFGVICYERLVDHEWSAEEQKFVQSVAQLLSLALETQRRKKLQEYLQVLLEQKNTLLAEINHRTKNNSSVILGMINLMKNKSRDKYHQDLLDQLASRVYSLSAVQEQLTATENFDRVDLSIYLQQLINNLRQSFVISDTVEHHISFEHVQINMRQASPIGLIVNEALTNIYKYAFNDTIPAPGLEIRMAVEKGSCFIHITDNGVGMNLQETERGMGIDLMYDLAEQLDGFLSINTLPGEGCSIEFQFTPETNNG